MPFLELLVDINVAQIVKISMVGVHVLHCPQRLPHCTFIESHCDHAKSHVRRDKCKSHSHYFGIGGVADDDQSNHLKVTCAVINNRACPYKNAQGSRHDTISMLRRRRSKLVHSCLGSTSRSVRERTQRARTGSSGLSRSSRLSTQT